MELSLSTDGTLAGVRILGRMALGETTALTEYLKVARENGAVRCIVDVAGCSELPTTIVAVLIRESAKFQEAGGALALSGVSDQNPFLTEAVASARFLHYRTLEEAYQTERVKAVASV